MSNEENKSRIKKAKTALLAVGLSILGGKAVAQEAPVLKKDKNQNKTEVSADNDKTASTKSLLAYKFKLSKENMEGFTSVGDVSQNVYKNDKGQEISQTFSKVGSWVVMDESLPNGTQHIVAKKGKKTLDFTQNASSEFVNGTYSEKISDTEECTAKFVGELGSSKFSINSNDFSSVSGLASELSKITKTAAENREQFNDLQRNFAEKTVNLQSTKDAKSSISFAKAAKEVASR